MMQLAFCLYKYFPFGGLQRDFVRIAKVCQARGHSIRVYTLSWQGEIPEGFEVVVVPVRALTNHKRYQKFTRWVQDHLNDNSADVVVGFNKMPGLDVYYAADPCYEHKAQELRGGIYRRSGRYKHFYNYEKAVFGANKNTEVLMISEVQKPLFIKHYRTADERFHLLPPGISLDRKRPKNAQQIRQDFRQEFNLADDEYLVLMVGSGFKTKGVDRTLKALKALPLELRQKTKVIIIGQDNPKPFLKMAANLGIAQQVNILTGRDDIPRFLLGADLLIHPAYSENTGTVLLEAAVAGLPVLASDVCGYAHYLEEANVGKLVVSPFEQESLDELLETMLLSSDKSLWQGNGVVFSEQADIYSLPERAADIIENIRGKAN